ncbi:hypothetical protein Z517_01727 [Fonsecaea pedrosoi CBS 271.37]|uniref:RING-type domain-containing protein n=1 Tax=Fonsecaea pedrosoi CBS 271.37 TaxID=1442368 RepID=A0A0D2E848_9EURO|nr:uncharacterized protein Z517_01727 [Fonsecaea pedrosoi CBS 271.37]KIW86331.1 hypothetical protein Z517_01727 [Fonsecaea pedrosoi CBS 271.37]
MATSEHGKSLESTGSEVRLRIKGLRRYLDDDAPEPSSPDDDMPIPESEETILLPGDIPVSELWTKLEELGYVLPDSLSRNGEKWKPGRIKPQLHEFEQITVVQDDLPSDPSKSIHIDDRLIAYANRHFGQAIQFNVGEDDSNLYGTKIDSLKDSRGLEIIFHRTVRMPDDEKLHQLPGSLGAFPLYSVEGYANKLPSAIVQAGGVFMPMWQREALWISLEARIGTRYALRFSVGRINAVSGEKMDQEKDISADGQGVQDYVVVPGQEWLDGICVAPGIVRQFVAMPLGSGYTVEGQKTGEEKHGGLQIEIIPAFQERLRTWAKDQTGDIKASDLEYGRLNEHSTPRQLGFGVGNTIRLYPEKAVEYVPATVADMVGGAQVDEDCPVSISCLLSWKYMSSYSDAPRRPQGVYQSIESMGVESALANHGFEHMMATSSAYTRGESLSMADQGLPALAAADEGFDAGEFEAATYQDMSREPQMNAAESKPTITTKDLKAMGLAAGGKLVQDIYRDHNPASIWNTEAARLVHVHILDPASCEAVTHVVPPPPPIDAMGYVEEGGAFFVVEEQPENRVDGGDFDNVKSVSAMDQQKGVQSEPSLDPSQPTRVRPCDHQFCNVCVREVDPLAITRSFTSAEPPSREKWFCPTCKRAVSYVAGFSAPMNLPGEETVRVRVPVNVLEVKDGRVAFKSIQQSRI